MSDTRNPFEEAMTPGGSEVNPFASDAADLFGSFTSVGSIPAAESQPVQPLAPALSLGSKTAANPFEAAASTVAPSEVPPAKPAIDLGSQAGNVIPFTGAAQTAAPATESDDGQTGLFGAEPEDEEGEPPNPLEAAMALQEKTENASIFAKAPIFEHGAVKEPIEDLNQTF